MIIKNEDNVVDWETQGMKDYSTLAGENFHLKLT